MQRCSEIEEKDHNSNVRKFWWCSFGLVTLIAVVLFFVVPYAFVMTTRIGIIVFVVLGLILYRVAFSTNGNNKSNKNNDL